MSAVLASLFARWAALEPDWCRPLPGVPFAEIRVDGEGWHALHPERPTLRDRALILWQVLSRAKVRGLDPCVFAMPETTLDDRTIPATWTGQVSQWMDEAMHLDALADEDDPACPATAMLGAYVTALEVLAARASAEGSDG